MSGLFGAPKSQAAIPTRYNGIQIGTSSSGNCVSLLYGQQRLPFNLMWYGNFNSTSTNSSSGGKGGGSQQPTGWSYSASFAAGICEGPITSIQQVWIDKDLKTLSGLGLTLFTGAGGQAVWSYLSSDFPQYAIPYDHICYVGAENYALGDSAAMPNITFEVQGFGCLTTPAYTVTATAAIATGAQSCTLTSPFAGPTGLWTLTFSDFESYIGTLTNGSTAVTWQGPIVNANSTTMTATIQVGGYLDADPSFVVYDYLTDPNHGIGLSPSNIGTLTGANSYQSYCYAQGFFLSPYESTQRAAADFLREIFQITNSDALWSAGVLKVIPYVDAPVYGNNYSYVPNLTPEYVFTDDDYLEPPVITRTPIADTYNHIRVEYLDRSDEYNTQVAEATDLGNIAQTGERVMDTLTFHEITNSTVARIAAQLQLQTSLYERNTLKVKVRSDYCLLEPMDFIGIADAGLGYTDQVFQIRKVTDDDNDVIEIEALEITGTVRTSALYNWSATQGYNANYAESAGNVQPPAFLEASGVLVGSNGGVQLWIAVDGASGNAAYGGCNVFMSFDGTTYDQIGTMPGAARYGTITSNVTAVTSVPDTVTSMGVALNNSSAVLNTGTAADAQDNRLLVAVGSGANVEVMSYETATMVSAGNYTLTTLYRGLYGSEIQTHSSGAQFMRLDGSIFALPIDPGWMGQTLYFKFCSFNNVGRATQDISTVTAYTYIVSNSNTAFNSVSSSTFVATGNCSIYSPTTAFKQTTGAVAWDSSIYSAQGYTNGCTAEMYASQTDSKIMLGLTTNPSASSSYTNLNYAWYANDNDTVQIYESGTLVLTMTGVAYTTSDLFALVYDGKHVSYYCNTTLVRSVPIANQTFYMQICFNEPGGAVYGISFDSLSTVVTPFTIETLTQNVAAAGTTVIANAQDTTAQWNARNYQSVESYNNGCQLSFSYNTGLGSNYLLIGLSPDPATGSGSTGLYFAAFQINSAGYACYTTGGTGVASGTVTTSPSDVWTITYDNFTIHWWRNGSIVAQLYSPNAGALYLFGDFYINGIGVHNVSFGAYGQLSPNPFIATGSCVTNDSTAFKLSSGAAAWDSAVYSINAYTTCHVQFKTTTTSYVAVGLTTNPTASNSYVTLNYCWLNSTTANEWHIWESATYIGSYGIPADTDLPTITYDGSTVTYYLNGNSVRTVSTANQTFYMSSSFNSPGASINSLSFGPAVNFDLVPTASIDANAVSQIISSYVGTFAFGSVNSGTTPATSTVNIIGITSTGSPIAIDISSTAAGVSVASSSVTSLTFTLQIARNGTVISNTPTVTITAAACGYVSGSSTSGFYTIPFPVTWTFTDSAAPAGSNEYAFYVTATQTGGNTSSSNVYLNDFSAKIREIKK